MPPAATRVVPREEMTVVGVGVMPVSLETHWVVSASTMAWSLGGGGLGLAPGDGVDGVGGVAG